MDRMAWTSRVFSFDLPESWLTNVLERLYGTPARLKIMLENVSEEEAGQCLNGAWSIKEHIGHLHDLEELHIGRIEDLHYRKEVLRAADMRNQKTEEAEHHKSTIDKLLKEFSSSRMILIDRIKELDEESQMFSSMHPRLKVKMRAIDVASFTADHDDHHLATIRSILNELHKD